MGWHLLCIIGFYDRFVMSRVWNKWIVQVSVQSLTVFRF